MSHFHDIHLRHAFRGHLSISCMTAHKRDLWSNYSVSYKSLDPSHERECCCPIFSVILDEGVELGRYSFKWSWNCAACHSLNYGIDYLLTQMTAIYRRVCASPPLFFPFPSIPLSRKESFIVFLGEASEACDGFVIGVGWVLPLGHNNHEYSRECGPTERSKPLTAAWDVVGWWGWNESFQFQFQFQFIYYINIYIYKINTKIYI